MTVQTVPYALQNAAHSAAVFRQSASAPFATGGILSQFELAVVAQTTPNMSVALGPGRAKVPGTAVAAPSGLSFTTQAMYDVLNDGPITLSVATANATNPRIDAVYIGVQDSFYSGSSNQALAGIVTGTPAATPVAPAVPQNSILLAYIAVGANATAITSANISAAATVATAFNAVDTGWITPSSMQNAIGTGLQTPQYRKIGDRVSFRGDLARNGSLTTRATAFTLPAGFIPSAVVLQPIGVSTWQADVQIDTAGNLGIQAVTSRAIGTQGFALTGVTYLVD